MLPPFREGGGRVRYSNDFLNGDLSLHKQHGAVGAVGAADEVQQVGGGVLAQAPGVAEDVASEGMSGEEQGLEVIVDEFCRGVVVALYLVDDDLALLLEFLLGEGAVEDDVHEQRQRAPEVLAEEGGVVDGLFLSGVGIEVAAHALHAVEDLHGGEVGSALEGHVFHEVCHAALAVELVACACGDGNACIDDVGGGGCEHDAQAAGEGEGVDHLRM